MTTIDDTKKAAALKLLQRGQITQSEAARLAGVSHQLMRYWSAQINCDAARSAYVDRIWAKAVRGRN